jgi:hypothetical protein
MINPRASTSTVVHRIGSTLSNPRCDDRGSPKIIPAHVGHFCAHAAASLARVPSRPSSRRSSAIKLVAFVLSGSGAMLAKAIHSAADTGNQLLSSG